MAEENALPPSFLIEIGNRRPIHQEQALHGQIGSLRRLGRKRCQKRKKSIWTTEEITPFPGRTGVQVQGGTSSRSADVEKTSVHRRRDGAQDWCGPAGSVLSGERVPGRNEAMWVHVRNCLHACNRTRRPTDWRWSGTGYQSFLRTCVVEDCNTVRTSLKKGNLARTNWDQTEVFRTPDTGTPTFSLNLRERPRSTGASSKEATNS